MTQENFDRTYHKDHFSKWKSKSIIVFKTLAKKTCHFPLSTAITRLTNFMPEDFCSPKNKDHFSYWKNLAKSNSFGYTCEKLLSYPCSIFSNSGHVFRWIKKNSFQFYAGYPKKHLYTNFVSIGKIVSEEIFERNNIKNSKNSNMA